MEQLFFVALVVVVGLLRLFAQIAEKKRNAEDIRRVASEAPAEPRSAVPIPRAAPQTEEDRIRKFMEALGVPTSQTPPASARPHSRSQPQPVNREAPPRRRTIQPVDPFPRPLVGRPIAVAPPPIPAAAPAPAGPTERELMAQRRRERAAPFLKSAEFEVRDIGRVGVEDVGKAQSAAPVSGPVPIAARLATPGALRDAIILREILGPPRSMQSLEHAI